jgi:putative ABC transport system substrate-binding protein
MFGGSLAAPTLLNAQPGTRTLRIAFLDDGSETATRALHAVFVKRLAELGYSEGRNLVLERRYAQGVNERLPALAKELVALKPDVFVALATPSALAAKKATATIPIVFIGPTDPVGAGLVQSLARPGQNATGLTNFTVEIGPKWVELMAELAPRAKRLAYLSDVSNKGAVLTFQSMQKRSKALKLTVELLDGRRRAELERSFETLKRERFDGFIVGAATPLLEHRDPIVEFALREKLPAIYARPEYVEAGGLLSYGADREPAWARAAEYVHRIAQGANPAELPVERPSIIRMVINLKTAQAMGMTIPQSVLLRADQLIR